MTFNNIYINNHCSFCYKCNKNIKNALLIYKPIIIETHIGIESPEKFCSRRLNNDKLLQVLKNIFFIKRKKLPTF